MIISKYILALLAFQTFTYEPSYIREFHALENKQEEKQFIDTYSNYSVDTDAYVLALKMKQAEYAFFPWRKWNIFKSQERRLNQLIANHPQNIHLRYVRLMLQERTPSFLGFNEHIEEDRHFLLNQLEISDSTDYLDTYIKENTSL